MKKMKKKKKEKKKKKKKKKKRAHEGQMEHIKSRENSNAQKDD